MALVAPINMIDLFSMLIYIQYLYFRIFSICFDFVMPLQTLTFFITALILCVVFRLCIRSVALSRHLVAGCGNVVIAQNA